MIKTMHSLFKIGISKLFLKIDSLALQKKLIFSYVFIILLPMIIFSTYIFKDLNKSYIKEIVKKNEYVMEMEKLSINNNIETMERAAQVTLSDKEVIDYIQRHNEAETEELIQFNTNPVLNITRMQFSNPIIEHIHYFNDNPYVNEFWPIVFQEKRIANKSWYQKVIDLNGQDLWEFQPRDVEVIQGDPTATHSIQPKISLLREHNYPKDKHMGIIQIDMLLKNFLPKTYSSLQDGQSQMLMIDRNSNLYTNKESPFFKEIDPALIIDQFVKMKGNATTSFEFSNNNIPYLGIYTYIERLDAYLLDAVNLQSFITDTQKTRNKIIMVNIILIFILGLSTYFLNSLILKRLHILTDSLKKVRKGDFNFDINIKGNGEVGELAHHFRKMLKKINELIAEAVNKQASSKEAELKTLNNQIDSHFLYNTLENIKMLAEIENQVAISDALTSLGGMMRYNLKWTSEYVRLIDEINHIKNYISIMNIRYDDEISLLISIPDEFLEQEVLKISLQPIVENAVKHGAGTEMTIKAVVEQGAMIIELSDNGKGIPSSKVDQLNRWISMEETNHLKNGWIQANGIGLRNVNQRIQLFYGKDYGIKVESVEGEYTTIVMKIPYLILTGGVIKHA